MNKIVFVLMVCFLYVGFVRPVLAENLPITVCFTPGGECTDLIVKELGNARESVLIQAYSFTSAPIAKAIVEAYKRGVKVEAILDKSNQSEKYSAATFLSHAGVPVKIDAQHAIAHNKIMIIDRKVVITGSFNFTKSAQKRNAENLLVIRDKGIARRYIENWRIHAAHSDDYSPDQEGWSSKRRGRNQ